MLSLLTLCVGAAAAAGVDLGHGWVASVDGFGRVTAARDGRVALDALNVTFSIGGASGGTNPFHRLAEPIGFSAVAFEAELAAPLVNATLDAAGTARGFFCQRWTAPKCALLKCPGYLFWRGTSAGADACLPGVLTLRVDDRATLVAAAAVLRLDNATTGAAPAGVVGRLAFATASPPDERLVGFGNMPSVLDLKNASFTVIAQENGLGRGDEPISTLINVGTQTAGASGDRYTTYSAVPMWLSSRGYVGDVDTTRLVTVASAESRLEVGVLGRVGDDGANLFHATTRRASPDPAGRVATWAELQAAARGWRGPAPPFPEWPATGVTLGVMGGSAAVRAALANATALNITVNALWIQDWAGKSGDGGSGRVLYDWQPDDCLYPDWWALVAELKAEGVRTLSYANPFLTDQKVNTLACRPKRASMYDFAKRRGYLVVDDAGDVLLAHEELESGAATVDFTNSAARKWFERVLACHVAGRAAACDPESPFAKPPAGATPVAGFMADFGEHLPPVGVALASGADPLGYHNAMADDWARMTRAAVAGLDDALVFHRSGTAATVEAAGTFWAGDQEQSWGVNDGLASLPKTYVSAGLAGWVVHSDIGGMIFCETELVCRRTDELLGRWLELSAIADPWLRSHPSNGDGAVPQPWSSPANAAITRTAVALHGALAEYKTALVADATRGGPPVVRHAYFNCVADALDARAFDALGGTALLLGDDVLVAPVLVEGASTVDVIAPPECSRGAATTSPLWVDVWAPTAPPLRPLERVTLNAPLGRPAVLARNGTSACASLVAAAAALRA